MGYVVEFIKHISKRSQIVAHQLIWNMQTNMYIDEEMHHKDRKFSELISLFLYRSSLLIFFYFFCISCSVRWFGSVIAEYHRFAIRAGQTIL